MIMARPVGGQEHFYNYRVIIYYYDYQIMIMLIVRPGGGQEHLTEESDLSNRRNITTPDTLMDLVRWALLSYQTINPNYCPNRVDNFHCDQYHNPHDHHHDSHHQDHDDHDPHHQEHVPT